MDAGQPSLNAGTTEQHAAVQKTCCHGSLQTYGLIFLAFIKLVLSLVLLVILIDALLVLNLFGRPILSFQILIWIGICTDAVDMIIAIVVFISVCLKNRKIMKMYYIYSVCVFGALTVICCVIVFLFTGSFLAILVVLLIFLLIFVIQEGLNRLVKMELRKLEIEEQCV